MALENENGMVMPVSPMYGGNGGGFGFDNGWWILVLLLLAGNGWGNGFGFGGGGFAADGAALYPWMNQAEVTSSGFQNAATNTAIAGLQSSVTSGFGDVQTALCGGFAGVNASINGAQNALASQMYANQIADLERSFAAQTASTQGMNAIQTQLATCCCDNRAATADLKYTVATEACADRSAISDGIRDVITAQTSNTQAILDKLCALELDGYKRENDQLRSQLTAANLAASQVSQTSQIVDQTYNRFATCPVGTMPVYGNTPIFTCNNNGCGCGA